MSSFLDAMTTLMPFAGPSAGLASATKAAIAARAKNEVQAALAPEPEPEVDSSLQHVSGVAGTQAPTKAQWIAMTAVAATQPQNLGKYARSQGLELTNVDALKLKAAAKRTKIIMSHPEYGKMKINKGALTKLAGGYDSMGSIFGTFGKILTAPLAATALAASALSWGVNHVVLAPAHLLGKISNWGAKKGGWGNMPGYGGGAPPPPAGAPGAPGAPPVVPSTYIPPGVDPRQVAAYQRQAAAQAQSDAAQQQLAASAAASDAEAAAMDAESQAQQDQTAALQAQYGISPDGSDQMGATRADRTLALMSRRQRAPSTSGAWLRRPGQRYATLMVGGLRISRDHLGRVSILD